MQHRAILAGATTLLIILIPAVTRAADNSWTDGAGDDLWSSASNWSAGVPDGSSDVIFGQTGSASAAGVTTNIVSTNTQPFPTLSETELAIFRPSWMPYEAPYSWPDVPTAYTPIKSLTYTNYLTQNGGYHTTQIDAGVWLQIGQIGTTVSGVNRTWYDNNGNWIRTLQTGILVGSQASTIDGLNRQVYASIKGAGTLAMYDPMARNDYYPAQGASIVIREFGTANDTTHMATLDMSGLARFYAPKIGHVYVGVAEGNSQTPQYIPQTMYSSDPNNPYPYTHARGRWILADINSIAIFTEANAQFDSEAEGGTTIPLPGALVPTGGTSLIVGAGPQPNGQNYGEVLLGRVNTLGFNYAIIGGANGTGILKFNPAVLGSNPVVHIRQEQGGSVFRFGVGRALPAGGGSTLGIVDLTGGTVNASISALDISLGGSSDANNPYTITGVFRYDAGTVRVLNRLSLGWLDAGASGTSYLDATIEVLGSAQLICDRSDTNNPYTVIEIAPNNRGSTARGSSIGRINVGPNARVDALNPDFSVTVGFGSTANFRGTGVLNIAPGGQFNVTGMIAVDSNATLYGQGVVKGPDGSTTSGGELYAVSGATVSAGTDANTVGSFQVNKATLEGATLVVDLAGNTCDLFSTVSSLTLTGGARLVFNVVSELTGYTYVLASYGSLSGTFTTVVGLPSGFTLDYNYQGQKQIVIWTQPPPPPLLGDTNGDGVVDLADYNNVVNNLGATGPDQLGDTNNDQVVDLADYNNVVNNLGATRPSSLAVPEPASLGLLVLAGLSLLTGRKKA